MTARAPKEVAKGLHKCKKLMENRVTSLDQVSKFFASITPTEWVGINLDPELVEIVEYIRGK